MDKKTILEIYWIIAAVITIIIYNKQNKKISMDGVIGNTPNFGMLFAVIGGGLFAPVYGIVKFIQWVKKKVRPEL